MPATAVIINADDLGLWPAVTDGIIEAWAAGAISSATVFATAPDLPAIVARARAAGLPVGIHLNLTFGAPLCDPADVPALVGADGRFMKRQAWARPLPEDQVQRELAAQLARAMACGLTPTHLDSHHHIHNYPEVLAGVMALALVHRLPVRATSPAMRDALRAAGITTPDHFTMAFYGAQATEAQLRKIVEECPGGTLEIMTHPGHAAPDLPSSYAAERETELQVLLRSRAWLADTLQRGYLQT